MTSLLKPKNIRRIVVALALLAPIGYLFGTQISALAGSHGNEVLAEDNRIYSDPVYFDYNGDASDVSFSNSFFGVSALYGHSVVVDGVLSSAKASSFSYFYGDGFNTVSLPDVVLRSAYNARDVLLSDGILTCNIGVVDLGLFNWSYNASYGFYTSSGIDDLKLVETNEVGNLLCKSFTPNTYNNLYSAGTSGNYIAVISNKRIAVNSSLTDPVAFKASMAGVMLHYELETPVVSSVSSFAGHYRSVSPVSISFDSDIAQPFQFVYWQNVYSFDDYRFDLFGNMFGKSNFLTDWGADALSDDRHGFAPVGELFRYVDDNVLHLGDSSIGLMGFGYMYYVVHVLLLDLVAMAFVFIVSIPERILDQINGKSGGDW